MTTTAARQLRTLFAGDEIIRSLGVHDVFTAMIAAEAGLPLLFVGGFGVAASHLGMPDMGLLALPEMVDTVRRITARVEVPVIADGDTGHGGPMNVARTVRDLEAAGAAGVLLEDQEFPKRCGHFAGKSVIPAGEMQRKLAAALDARSDDDFVIMARTDALALEGIDAAIDRAKAYRATGADAGFVEAPQTAEDLARIAAELPFPQLANMLTGGKTPILSADELGRLGFRMMVCPVASLLIAGAGLRRLCDALHEQGRIDHLADEMMSFAEVKTLLGADALIAAESASRLNEPSA